MSIVTLTGFAAIQYAEAHGARLRKYADPTEDGRDDLTPDEALEVASEDPGLIYITVELDRDFDGDRLDTLELYEVNDGTLYLACPEEGIATVMPSDSDFLTDCRLYRDSWFPEDTPNHTHALAEVRGILEDQQTKHIATYRIPGDDLRIHLEPEEMGHAAREYMRALFEALA